MRISATPALLDDAPPCVRLIFRGLDLRVCAEMLGQGTAERRKFHDRTLNHAALDVEHADWPNETQARPRLRRTQVATPIGTLATLDMKKQRRLSRWLQRLI